MAQYAASEGPKLRVAWSRNGNWNPRHVDLADSSNAPVREREKRGKVDLLVLPD